MKTYRIQLPQGKRESQLWYGTIYTPDKDGFIDAAPADLCKALNLLPAGEPEPEARPKPDGLHNLFAFPTLPSDFKP